MNPNPHQSPRAKNGQFQKGDAPPEGARRKKGTPNKLTADIRQGCIDGFARHGSDGRGSGGFSGYIFYLAKRHPKAAARLIEKLLPLQIKSDFGAGHISNVSIVSVPAGHYLTAEDIDRLAAPGLVDESQLTRAVDPLVDRVAGEVAADASSGSPRRTGALASGWRVVTVGRGERRVVNSVPYARFVEYGTRHVRPAAMLGMATARARSRYA